MLAELRQLTAGPELGGRVCFTGQLRNPFTVLDQADCFVLPSTTKVIRWRWQRRDNLASRSYWRASPRRRR